MDLAMAIHAAAIERVDIEAGDGLVTRQHEEVTRLTQHVCLGTKQLGVIRSMGNVASRAILTDRRMLPQERSALVGMAGVADLVRRAGDHHRPSLPAVRVVTGATGHFHGALFCAEDVSRALVWRVLQVLVTREADVGHREPQHRRCG